MASGISSEHRRDVIADDFAPVYIIIVLAAVSILACRKIPERAKQDLA